MFIGFLGAAIAKLHRLEAPPTVMHALPLLEAICLRGRFFQGLFLMRSLCFAYRWCSLPLCSYSCLMTSVCVIISYYKSVMHIGLESTLWISLLT